MFRALMGLAPRRGRSCVEGTAFASCAARRTRGSSETTTKTPAKAYRSDLWRVMAFARRLVVPARLLFAALRACGTPCDVFAGRYRAWASGGEVRRVSKNLQICKKAKTAACVRSSPCPHGGDHATTSSRAVCSSRVVRIIRRGLYPGRDSRSSLASTLRVAILTAFAAWTPPRVLRARAARRSVLKKVCPPRDPPWTRPGRARARS